MLGWVVLRSFGRGLGQGAALGGFLDTGGVGTTNKSGQSELDGGHKVLLAERTVTAGGMVNTMQPMVDLVAVMGAIKATALTTREHEAGYRAFGTGLNQGAHAGRMVAGQTTRHIEGSVVAGRCKGFQGQGRNLQNMLNEGTVVTTVNPGLGVLAQAKAQSLDGAIPYGLRKGTGRNPTTRSQETIAGHQ